MGCSYVHALWLFFFLPFHVTFVTIVHTVMRILYLYIVFWIVFRGTVSEDDVAAASVILTVVGTDADDILTDGNGNISFSIIGLL